MTERLHNKLRLGDYSANLSDKKDHPVTQLSGLLASRAAAEFPLEFSTGTP
ncbi:predicted protein [Streptomyces viridosporus ATCC 14672]|uniref:Predicted protein n=1 Tax=Streptomyces viridosporus (strain ATCC 14672 / DSM 40746 / JCM 4963 / KCTC 9882 / NRRL B-12104 / FH 1290) TaxID=566461 RepID=D6A776_STRV1|nr:predicted protein [Streptomyces viridosporus ATCC 14672]